MMLETTQIRIMRMRAESLLVLGAKGVMIAFLLSMVIASIVNTLELMVERETNWVMVQNI